ncbi:MAG: AarF/ABC1/UbiB kinase family protein [Bdellovibrionales bacterium]|nr:AarF/ABC1/UbiB kinase family protein [Bdellovibrionales bacterium]
MPILNKIARTLQLSKLGTSLAISALAHDQPNVPSILAGMGSLHGLPEKFAQILGTVEMGRSVPYAWNSQALSPKQAFKIIEGELGAKIETVFNEIDPVPICASIGQVHRARLKDGRQVAVKVQYPSIKEQILTDLGALGWLSIPMAKKRAGFNLDEYRQELRNSVLRELDYQIEAQAIERFAARLRSNDEVRVPQVLYNLSTQRILVTEWMNGFPVHQILEWPKNLRLQIARIMLRWTLRCWLVWGEIHSDPHPGNYLFRESQGVPLIEVLDFGCTYRLPAPQLAALRSFLCDSTGESRAGCLELYQQMGFNPDLLEPISDKLPSLSALLTEPFNYGGVYALDHWRLSERALELLGDQRWNFRFAGPASLLHFIRSFSGFISYLKALRVDLNWRLELSAILVEIEPMLTEFADCERVTEAEVDNGQRLFIQVCENGQTKVQLCLKARLLECLEELMPNDLLEKLAQESIFPGEIGRQAILKGVPQGELFSFNDGNKQVRVWISQHSVAQSESKEL